MLNVTLNARTCAYGNACGLEICMMVCLQNRQGRNGFSNAGRGLGRVCVGDKDAARRKWTRRLPTVQRAFFTACGRRSCGFKPLHLVGTAPAVRSSVEACVSLTPRRKQGILLRTESLDRYTLIVTIVKD